MKQVPRNHHTEGLAFILFNLDKIYFNHNSKIIKKDEYSTILSLEQLQLKITEDIQQFKIHAMQELKAAKLDGFATGVKEGLNSLAQVIAKHEQILTSMQHDVSEIIYDIAFQAAEKIVFSTLQRQPDLIVNIVKSALQKVSASKKVVILINPSDLEYIETHRTSLTAITKDAKSFSIQASTNISAGGCIVQTGEGVINAEPHILLERLEIHFAKLKAETKTIQTTIEHAQSPLQT